MIYFESHVIDDAAPLFHVPTLATVMTFMYFCMILDNRSEEAMLYLQVVLLPLR